jgi:glycosyltransferase involved in cell wall biosynthesis
MKAGGGRSKKNSMSISSLCKNGTPTASNGVSHATAALDTSKMPRLLYVASTKSQGGIERHSVDLAAALAGRGIPIQFACRPHGFVETWCREVGLPVSAYQARNSGDLSAALQLARMIYHQRIDIVHVHSRRDYVPVVLGVALARHILRRRVALILHAHMIRPLGASPRLSGRFFEWGADAVAAVSGAVCDRLRHDHQFSPAFVHLIPNGVKLSEFALPGSPEAARQRINVRQSLGVPENSLVIGMIGRLDAKGQRQLLGVMPELLAHSPNLRVVLVGSEGKTGEQAALTALAQTGGFADRLIFTGPRTDIPQLVTAFDILVHLPTDEAFGLALVEAMAAGLPTVATDIGGCREVVRDGITGLLVPSGDSSALSGALLRLLDPAHGLPLRTELGFAGFHAAQTNFSQAIQINRLLALYHEICPRIQP